MFVCPQCVSLMCVLNVCLKCLSSMCVLNVFPHCMSSMYEFNVCPQCVSAKCVLIVRPQYVSSMCVLVCPQCVSWCVLYVCLQSASPMIVLISASILTSASIKKYVHRSASFIAIDNVYVSCQLIGHMSWEKPILV